MSVTVRLFDGPKEQWDEFVSKHPQATFFHQHGWLEVIRRAYGGQPYYLAAYQGDEIVGVLPMVLKPVIGHGRVLVSVPFADEGGVCAANEEVAGALVDAAKEIGERERAAYVELRQLEPLEYEGLLCDTTRVVLRMDLPGTADELWKSFSSNMRKKIRRSRRDGLTAATVGPEALAEFYGVYAKNMRDLGSPMQSYKFFEGLVELWPEDTVVVKVAHESGKTVGGAVAVQFRDVLTVLCAHSLREYHKLFPNNLLYWHIFEEAIERGCTVADFGRSPKGSGIYNFKKLWGMEDCQLYRMILPLRSAPLLEEKRESMAYRVFSVVWRRMPVSIAQRIGPWIFARLPL